MSTLRIYAAVAALIAGSLLAYTWREARADRARLQATLASQQQVISAAELRERASTAQLKSTLDQIAALKRQIQTPQQIVNSLPQYLPLPEPITLIPEQPAKQGTKASPHSQQGIGASPQIASSARPSSSTTAEKGTDLPSAPLPDSASLSFLSRLKAKISNQKSERVQPPGSANCESNSASAAHTASPPPKSGISNSNSPSVATTPLKSEISNLNSPNSGSQSAAANPTANSAQSSPPATNTCPPLPPGTAEIPAADLKPLFDFVQDSRACEAELASARAALKDEQARSAALARERNAAVTATKGGSLWRQLKRNAKWLAIGAITGAAATHNR